MCYGTIYNYTATDVRTGAMSVFPLMDTRAHDRTNSRTKRRRRRRRLDQTDKTCSRFARHYSHDDVTNGGRLRAAQNSCARYRRLLAIPIANSMQTTNINARYLYSASLGKITSSTVSYCHID